MFSVSLQPASKTKLTIKKILTMLHTKKIIMTLRGSMLNIRDMHQLNAATHTLTSTIATMTDTNSLPTTQRMITFSK